MSTIVSSDRRIWVPMVIALALIVGGLVAVLNLPTSIAGMSLVDPSRPAIPQAKWVIRAYPAGALGKVKGKELKQLERQEPAIRDLIRSVYDAAFIDHDSLKEALNRGFIDSAANALISARVGFPSSVSSVRTLKREASVDIDARRADHAAATVRILAKGQLGDRVVKISHRSLLWMEKDNGKWRVIGFELTQEPVT
jgi:hypothetical protein